MQDADAGWLVGNGGRFDPCVDQQAVQNTIVAFAVFGALLLVVAADYCLVKLAGVDLLACAPFLRLGRGYTWWRAQASWARCLPPALVNAVRAGYYAVQGAALTLDVVTDVLLVTQLVPLTVGYVLLTALLAGHVATGLAVHIYLLSAGARASTRRNGSFGTTSADSANSSSSSSSSSASSRDGSTHSIADSAADAKVGAAAAKAAPSPTPSIGASGAASSEPAGVLGAYAALARHPLPLLLTTWSLAAPLVGTAFDVLLLAASALHVLRACAGCCAGPAASSPPAMPARLDLGRCYRMRSLVTTFFSSLPSIAFTTWGYLATHKFLVGKYITATVFMLNLGTSMAHALSSAWLLKESLLLHGGLAAALADIFDLGSRAGAGAAGAGAASARASGSGASAAGGSGAKASGARVSGAGAKAGGAKAHGLGAGDRDVESGGAVATAAGLSPSDLGLGSLGAGVGSSGASPSSSLAGELDLRMGSPAGQHLPARAGSAVPSTSSSLARELDLRMGSPAGQHLPARAGSAVPSTSSSLARELDIEDGPSIQ